MSLTVLARLLTPDDYGIVALATVATGLLAVVTELQVSQALLRIPNPKRPHYDTAFTISLIRGVITALILFASAGLVARAMNEPALASVLRVLSVVPLVDGLRNPRFVDFARDVDLSKEAIVSFLVRGLSIVGAIVAAFSLRNYWALVIGSLVGAAAGTGYTYAVRPYLPRFALDHWREFFAFGGWLAGAGVVRHLNYRSDVLILGATMPLAAVGQYNMGDQISTMATNQLASPLQQAIYSGLARVGNESSRLDAAYLRAQAATLGLLLPIGVGSAFIARELVLLIAGSQWEGAIIVVQYIAPVVAISMVVNGAQAMLMVHGQTREIFRRDLALLFLRIPSIIAGLRFFGIPGLLIARVGTSLAYTSLTLAAVAKVRGGSFLDPIRAGWRSIVATIAMAGILAVLSVAFVRMELPLVISLGLKLLAGALSYSLGHWILWRLGGRPSGFETIVREQMRSLYRREPRHARGLD